MPNVLNATEILALSKAVASKDVKAARNGVAVGSHNVNFLVRVEGSMNVGEDYEKAQVCKIDWIGLTAMALSKLNGVTIESLVADYEAAGEVALDEIKSKAQAKIDKLKGSTIGTDRGKVTTKLAYTVLDATPEMVAGEVGSLPDRSRDTELSD